MKLSRFFSELSSAYGYEIEDLTYDSAGANVLASRLKVKREQFADLLPMCEFAPEMVAPAFHGGFKFVSKAALEKLVSSQPEGFPSWASVAEALELQPWADKLATQALGRPDGERLMLISAGLEYIASAPAAAVTPAAETTEARPDDDGEDRDDDDSDDLGDAGEDYLNDQGFDRRS
jgi:hypothetical protein